MCTKLNDLGLVSSRLPVQTLATSSKKTKTVAYKVRPKNGHVGRKSAFVSPHHHSLWWLLLLLSLLMRLQSGLAIGEAGSAWGIWQTTTTERC